MLAATVQDGAVAVGEHETPVAGADEVLVRVVGAGVNGADILQVAGRYPPPPGASDVLGMELAGEVVDDGGRFHAGDRVMAIVSAGAQAEYCVVPQPQLVAVPDNVPLDVAGGFPEVFTTAHDALVTQADLKPGERLLVHGAAGGVGTAAVQLGRALGAEVTATVRDPERHEAVRALGATTVLSPEEFADSARDLEFDVVLELVGAVNLQPNLQALAVGGRIATIGIGAGAKGEINLALLLAKRGRIFGSTLRARSVAEKGATARALERDVVPLLAAGDLEIPVLGTYSLADAAGAYERFKAGGKLGKVLITP